MTDTDIIARVLEAGREANRKPWGADWCLIIDQVAEEAGIAAAKVADLIRQHDSGGMRG